MKPHTNAIIIGGGPAGLLAAAHLAEAGISTTLLEAKGNFGGRSSSHCREGLHLNQGPHALYLGGAGRREVQALGIDPPGWQREAERLYIHEGELRDEIPGGEQLQGWLGSVKNGESGDDLAQISVDEWLDRSLEGAARDAAAGLVRVTTLVADHGRFSADVAELQLRNALQLGVRYLRGGWQTLVDEIAAEARRRGATLRTSAPVRALTEEDGGWTVSLEDEQLRADIVILATGGQRATERLLGERTPAASGPAAEVSTLDLGLRKLPKPNQRFALALDRPAYVGHYSPPEQESPQLQTAISFVRVPSSELDEIFDLVQPGWREEMVVHRYLSRMIASTALTVPESGGLAGRPGPEVQPDLYVVGDWIGSEGWLGDAAMASAAVAARAAIASRTGSAAPA